MKGRAGDMVILVRALRFPAAVLLAAAALMGAGGPANGASPCGALVDVDDCLDDFTCYRISRPQVNNVNVTLVDQFESTTAIVSRPSRLCTPSDKEGEGTLDEDTHLAAYRLRRHNPPHIERTGIRMTNQLGDIWLNTTSAYVVLVPTSKDLNAVPAPPSATSNVDTFKCYRAEVTPGTPKFARNTRVSVSDQFSAARDIALLKPRYLCTPVNLNGGGTANPDVHLVCYSAKPAVGEPKHTRVRGLFMRDQFSTAQVNTRREAEFCIPSTKSFSPAP
jgi:hypothetical protein